MHVTVAVCTWNRAGLLDQTLRSMAQLAIPTGVEWELLVVNNNCADETDLVVERHASRLPIRCVFEPRPGLSNARNCAIRAARGRLIVWTDDDVLVSTNWLAEYAAAAGSRPEFSFFGGPISPCFEAPQPRWLEAVWSELQGVYGSREFHRPSFEIDKDTLPFGANFAVRTELQRGYAFDPALGRQGEAHLVGEETSLLGRLLADGYRGLWLPHARIQHFIPRQHATLSYVRRRFFGFGQTDAILERRQHSLPRGDLWKRAIASEVKWRVRRWFAKPERWVKHLTRASYLRGQLSVGKTSAST